jgi:ubiquinone biosynthesis protein
MSLTLRLVRATWLFALIFASYMVQLGLARLFSKVTRDPTSGRERTSLPGWLTDRRERVDTKNAKRLLAGMLKLRGVFIKLGQVLSIMGGFLPRAFTTELESLQDNVPPHPFKDVEEAFQLNMGKSPEACFKSIEREPLAAASLGQVHVAYLASGEKVAVKILYPGIRDVIRVDMKVLGWVVRVYKLFFPFRNLERVHASLVDLLHRETDYIHEADCMDRMAGNFEGETDILFPKVVRELTTKDILTMSFMEGVKITRFDEFERLGINREIVATRLIQSFYKQLFADRFFHADPHPGNFLVQPGDSPDRPKIVVLDFGAISEASENLIDGLLEILQGAVLMQDGDQVVRGFKKMGFVAEDGNKKLLEQTVITYFQKFLRIKDRSPAALVKAERKDLQKLVNPELETQELRELMRSIDYPEGWFYVERAGVLMFWLAARIAPDIDAAMVGLPYVMPILQQRLLEKMAADAAALEQKEQKAAVV